MLVSSIAIADTFVAYMFVGLFSFKIVSTEIYLQAKKIEDVEDLVPYQPGVKRGKVYEKPEKDEAILPPAQLDAELEECLDNATEAELTDIAGGCMINKMPICISALKRMFPLHLKYIQRFSKF